MKDRRAVAALFAVATGLSPLAHGATQDEISEMRAQIKALREDYEARIGALERRLKDAEARAAAPAPAPAPAPVASAPSSSAFNPAVSLVLQGMYANLSQDPKNWRLAGFAPGGEIGPPKRGFSLGESELNLSANVDERFSGVFIASVTPEDTIGVEEAYGLWRGGPAGTTPKFGRFLSGIGYLNEQHAHAWDFADAPLAYQAFLGGQRHTDGVQAKWVAPTELFVELSGEVGDGRDKNGIGSGAAAAHLGGDVGESHSWRAGLSYLDADARLGIADFVWKWAPNGNGNEVNAKVQGEYVHASTQSGWYLQGVYQFMPRWRVGARYDRLDSGAGFEPKRWSAMLDWSPSEFSRFRVQFQRAQVIPERTDNEFFLQYILSLGAHGAHRY